MFRKLPIIMSLVFLVMFTVEAAWQKVVWDVFKEVAIDTAIDAVQDIFKDDVKPEQLATLKNKVSDLESQLYSYTQNGNRPPDFDSVEKTILNLSNMINMMDSRIYSLERRVSIVEKNIASLTKMTLKNNDSSLIPTWEIRKPIDNVFRAWETLDVNLYMQQWSKNAVQFSSDFYRHYQDIKRKRTIDFKKKYRKVTAKYEIVSIIATETVAVVGVRYSMSFIKKNGRIFKENNIKERYILTYNSNIGQWLIEENYDYMVQ